MFLSVANFSSGLLYHNFMMKHFLVEAFVISNLLKPFSFIEELV